MITVETSLSALEKEEKRLQSVDGPNSRLYALGALDAIRWVMRGSLPPSERGIIGREEAEKS